MSIKTDGPSKKRRYEHRIKLRKSKVQSRVGRERFPQKGLVKECKETRGFSLEGLDTTVSWCMKKRCVLFILKCKQTDC